MKTATGKSIVKNGIIMLSALILFAACNKDSDSSTSEAVSEEEAAEAISQSVTPESNGMVAQVSAESVLTTSYAFWPCGLSHDSSFTQSSLAGALISYNVSYTWGWMLNCGNPATFTSNFKGHVIYDAPRMSSNDSSKGSSVVTGLDAGSTTYTVSQQYIRNGSQQSKIWNKNSFTSLITITSSDIKVSKITYEIISGTAAVTMSGATTNGISFSYNGNLVFKGNKTATLTMSSGTSYNISWL